MSIPEGSTSYDSEGERLVHAFSRIVICVPSNRLIQRMRFVVTHKEFREIEEYAFKRDGRFFGRIKNIPLIIEEEPDADAQPLIVTFAPQPAA